jgi:hypothetical protein
MIRSIVGLTIFLVLIGCASPILAQEASPATTNCSFTFTAGKNNAFLQYCVTANGNIPQIETPLGHHHMGAFGEGYGLCQESDGARYLDYATVDNGFWGTATVVSRTAASVKIARSTKDGRWTLIQTITKVAKSSSITVVMALTNNQPVDRVAYLSRYADVDADGSARNFRNATLNSSFAWTNKLFYRHPFFGLQLQNVGTPPFGFWQAYAKTVNPGPDPCSFADNREDFFLDGEGSFVLSYVGPVPAHQTKTVTMTYRGL